MLVLGRRVRPRPEDWLQAKEKEDINHDRGDGREELRSGYRQGACKAASIERALRLAGEDARIVFPIDAELFFAAEDTQEGIDELPTVGNEEVAA